MSSSVVLTEDDNNIFTVDLSMMSGGWRVLFSTWSEASHLRQSRKKMLTSDEGEERGKEKGRYGTYSGIVDKVKPTAIHPKTPSNSKTTSTIRYLSIRYRRR